MAAIHAKLLLIEEANTRIVFPFQPRFNMWLSPRYEEQYVWPATRQRDPEEPLIETVLVNWANLDNRISLHVAFHNGTGLFQHSDAWKFLIGMFDGITLRGEHVIIERPQDLVMFRMQYGEQLVKEDDV